MAVRLYIHNDPEDSRIWRTMLEISIEDGHSLEFPLTIDPEIWTHIDTSEVELERVKSIASRIANVLGLTPAVYPEDGVARVPAWVRR